MRREQLISLAIGAAFGGAIWGFSPFITGMVEPWDAESPYYFVALLLVGAILGLFFPRNVGAIYTGVLLGQSGYLLLYLPSGPLSPLGLVFLCGYGLLSALGALVASRCRGRSGGSPPRRGS